MRQRPSITEDSETYGDLIRHSEAALLKNPSNGGNCQWLRTSWGSSAWTFICDCRRLMDAGHAVVMS